MPIFRHQSIHTLLAIDTFSPSFLFTLVNDNTSTIVNTPFFSRRHLIRRKVVHTRLSRDHASFKQHSCMYLVFSDWLIMSCARDK